MYIEGGLSKLIDATLSFEYSAGAVTPIANGHDTGVRTMPHALCVQNMGDMSTITLDGGLEMAASHGEAFVIPEGVTHRIKLVDPGRSVSRWAHFRLTFLETVDAFRVFRLPKIFKKPVAQRLGDLCEELAEASSGAGAGFSVARIAAVKALGFRLGATILENAEPIENLQETFEIYQRLSPLLKSLNERGSGRLTLPQMAHKCNLSVSRFCTLFQRTLGDSPVRHQARIRLMKAKSLLLKTGLSVSEISQELGYKDQFHFSKAFKRDCGASPTDYRLQARSGLGDTGF